MSPRGIPVSFLLGHLETCELKRSRGRDLQHPWVTQSSKASPAPSPEAEENSGVRQSTALRVSLLKAEPESKIHLVAQY